MAKSAKTGNKQQPVSKIVDTYIEVPAAVSHLVKALDDNSEEKPGHIRIVFNVNTAELTREVTSELLLRRGVPLDDSTPTASDPLVLYVLATYKTMSASEAISRVKTYYANQREIIQQDALTIGITDFNVFDMIPTPYEKPKQEESTAPSVVPSWRKSLVSINIPEPKRDLTNPYEARLKTIADFLAAAEEADPFFTGRFRQAIDQSFANVVQGLVEETDEDGFLPGSSN